MPFPRHRAVLAGAAVLLLLLGLSSCAAPSRTPLGDAALLEHAVLHQARALEDTVRHAETIRQRIRAESADSRASDSTFDILLLSGGGQYGAFGAGVLRGWTDVPDAEFSLPRFDLVTGVSTGSLISPFAFAGSAHELIKAEHYYRETRQDLALLRGMLFFLPWRESFFDISGLRTSLEEELGAEELAAIRAGHAEGRLLLVATTDLDLGAMRIWDLGQEATARDDDADALQRIRQLLLGSAAIPAAFPPVEIDGHLHVDGGVSESLFLPHQALIDGLSRRNESAAHPPRVRIWAIVNGRISPDVSSTGLGWPEVAARSSHVSIHLALATELRRIELFARWLESVTEAKVEFRYLAIPADFNLPPRDVKNLFDRDLMNQLADLGESLGRNPANWRQDPPRPESLPASPSGTRRTVAAE